MTGITSGMQRCLDEMVAAERAERYEDAEIVCDGLSCWLGLRRVHRRTVYELLRIIALSEDGDGKCQRYRLTGTGRILQETPLLASGIRAALVRGEAFSVVEGTIVPLDRSQSYTEALI